MLDELASGCEIDNGTYARYIKENINQLFIFMKKKNYTPPRTQVIKLQQFASILNTSPGSGNIPQTGNDNNDNDWP